MNIRMLVFAVGAVIGIVGSCTNGPEPVAGVSEKETLLKVTYRYDGEELTVFFKDSIEGNTPVETPTSKRIEEIVAANSNAGFAVDPVDNKCIWLYTNDTQWEAVLDSMSNRSQVKTSLAKSSGTKRYGSFPVLFQFDGYSGCNVCVSGQQYSENFNNATAVCNGTTTTMN
jgi:hypothetical protein